MTTPVPLVPFRRTDLATAHALACSSSDPRWEIEGDGYYSPHDNDAEPCCSTNQVTDVNAHAFAMRLNYNFPIRLLGRQSQFILGAGGVRTSYKFKGGAVRTLTRITSAPAVLLVFVSQSQTARHFVSTV